MYHAACKVEFQPFTRSYSQLTFFNFKKQKEYLYSSPQGVQNTSLMKASTRATSRHPEDGSTSYLRCRPLYAMVLPDTKRVGRGLIICRGGRPIVTRTVLLCVLFFYDNDTSTTTRCDVDYTEVFYTWYKVEKRQL